MAETVGDRCYSVRLALGDGKRTPMPMLPFSKLLTAHPLAERRYGPSTISDIETGKRAVGLDDVKVYAAIDPLGRGRAWLAFGEEPAEPPKAGPIYSADQVPPPIPGVPIAAPKRAGGGKAG